MTDEEETNKRNELNFNLYEKTVRLTYSLWNALLMFNGILISTFSILAALNKNNNINNNNKFELCIIGLSMISSFFIVYNFRSARDRYKAHLNGRERLSEIHLEVMDAIEKQREAMGGSNFDQMKLAEKKLSKLIDEQGRIINSFEFANFKADKLSDYFEKIVILIMSIQFLLILLFVYCNGFG